MALDFKHWAVLAPKNTTGFGRMAQDAQSILGIPYHCISITHHLTNLPLEKPNEYWIDKSYSKDQVRTILSSIPRLQAVLFFEYMDWNPHLMDVCQELGIKTACVVMWEWFSGLDPRWKQCSVIICPSTFAQNIVHSYGYTHTVVLPWVLDLAKLPARKVSGTACVFGHNAGVIDAQDRKGTLDTIHAFSSINDPDIRLVIRAQTDNKFLKTHDHRISVHIGNLDSPSELFSNIDAVIQPSKMEGIGFMVLEPVVSGMPTITLDYPPMNTYVHQPELLAKKKWFKRKAIPTAWHKHAHLRLPNINDLADKIRWCTQHDLSAISLYNRQWGESVFDPASLQRLWRHTLEPFFR